MVGLQRNLHFWNILATMNPFWSQEMVFTVFSAMWGWQNVLFGGHCVFLLYRPSLRLWHGRWLQHESTRTTHCGELFGSVRWVPRNRVADSRPRRPVPVSLHILPFRCCSKVTSYSTATSSRCAREAKLGQDNLEEMHCTLQIEDFHQLCWSRVLNINA